jgi:hypothetical protein
MRQRLILFCLRLRWLFNLINLSKALADKEEEVRKLKSKSKKSDDVSNGARHTLCRLTRAHVQILSTIQANMQCQICMDLLFRPHG